MKFLCTLLFTALAFQLSAQVNVSVDLSKPTHYVSPYLYDRNNSLSDNLGSGFTQEWTRLKDALVGFFRRWRK